VLFLDISPDVAKLRGGYGDERYEREEMQRSVRALFKHIGDDVGKVWVEIDASGDLQSVQEAIRTETNRVPALGPIQSLWQTNQA